MSSAVVSSQSPEIVPQGIVQRLVHTAAKRNLMRREALAAMGILDMHGVRFRTDLVGGLMEL